MEIRFQSSKHNTTITTPYRGARSIRPETPTSVLTIPTNNEVAFIAGGETDGRYDANKHTCVTLSIDDIRRAVNELRADGIDI